MTSKTKTAPKTTTPVQAQLAKDATKLNAVLPPAKTDKGPTKATAPAADSTRLITVPKPELTFKGQRGEWFALVAKCNGKSVADFNAAATGRKGHPGPWLRWFAKMGYVVVQ